MSSLPWGARTLVIAPHSDDLELGCGGTVARLVDTGSRVTELIMATGTLDQSHRAKPTPLELRRTEANAAAEVLGIERVLFALDAESRLDCVEMALGTRIVQETIDAVKPQVVLVNLPSSHQDHRWVYDCTVAALRPCRCGHHPTMVLGYEYPLLYWGHYDAAQRPIYVDVSRFMERKMQAIGVYASQLRPGIMSGDAVRAFSHLRGLECGVDYAERFSAVHMLL